MTLICALSSRLPFGVFQDLFWRLKMKHPGKIVISCPDVMFNIYDRDITDDKYAALARKWEVKKWVDSSGKVRWYGCRRGHSYTGTSSCSFHRGLGVPPCDLENLADAIKFVMKECEDAGLFCELQEGTLLGKRLFTQDSFFFHKRSIAGAVIFLSPFWLNKGLILSRIGSAELSYV